MWNQTAFDSSWIKEKREAHAFRIPEFFGECEKWPVHFLTLFIEQVNAAVCFAATHRRGEVNVELQLVFRQNAGGRIEALHDGRRRHHRFRNCEPLNNRVTPRRLERGTVRYPCLNLKLRHKHESALFHLIGTKK